MHSLRVAFRDFSARIAIAAGLCVVVMAGGVFMVNRYIDGKIDDIPRVDVAVAPQSGDAVNFVIVGSDTRSFIKNQRQFDAFSDDATQSAPPRSDTLMVLHADGDRSYAVSFPRDLWVEVPGLGHAKINAAFNDGAQSVVDTLSTDFGLDLNHYLEVDFETFQQLVDAIGTVPVYFPTAARDEFTGLNVWGAGCYRLDGPAALSYVRSRDLKYLNTATGEWEDASPRGDLDRIARQQAFIKKLGRIAMDRVTGNPTIAPDVVDATIPNLKADTAFDRGAFNALARALLGLSTGDGTGLQFDTIPAEPASRDSQAVLLVQQGEADPMLARLRGEADVPPATSAAPVTGDGAGASAPSAALSPGNVRVQVLNGSGVQGQAAEVASELGRFGFVNDTPSNFPKTVAKTQVRYAPGDEAAAQLVAAYVPGAELVSDGSVSGSHVVLVVGTRFDQVREPTAPVSAAPAAAEKTPEQICDES